MKAEFYVNNVGRYFFWTTLFPGWLDSDVVDVVLVWIKFVLIAALNICATLIALADLYQKTMYYLLEPY